MNKSRNKYSVFLFKDNAKYICSFSEAAKEYRIAYLWMIFKLFTFFVYAHTVPLEYLNEATRIYNTRFGWANFLSYLCPSTINLKPKLTEW